MGSSIFEDLGGQVSGVFSKLIRCLITKISHKILTLTSEIFKNKYAGSKILIHDKSRIQIEN